MNPEQIWNKACELEAERHALFFGSASPDARYRVNKANLSVGYTDYLMPYFETALKLALIINLCKLAKVLSCETGITLTDRQYDDIEDLLDQADDWACKAGIISNGDYQDASLDAKDSLMSHQGYDDASAEEILEYVVVYAYGYDCEQEGERFEDKWEAYEVAAELNACEEREYDMHQWETVGIRRNGDYTCEI